MLNVAIPSTSKGGQIHPNLLAVLVTQPLTIRKDLLDKNVSHRQCALACPNHSSNICGSLQDFNLYHSFYEMWCKK